MIGKLKGTVEEVMQDHIILDVCGIGYLVYTTQNIMSSLTLGAKAEFYTEQHITENSVKLYGLQSKEDIKVLKVLIKAKGVNYKTAITLIDKLGADGVITSIQQQNLQNLKAKGIGPKLTQRIVTELRPEFLKMQTQSSTRKCFNVCPSVTKTPEWPSKGFSAMGKWPNLPSFGQISSQMCPVLWQN